MSKRYTEQLPAQESSPDYVIDRPLFDGPLDLDEQGGIVVLDTGQLAEVAPPNFVRDGWDSSPTGRRMQALPFDLVEEGDGAQEIRWRAADYDPAAITIGMEMEHFAMRTSTGEWHAISPDGESIHYPDHKVGEQAEERGHQPELLKYMTESGTDPDELYRGHQDFADSSGDERRAKSQWAIDHGVTLIPIGAYPERLRDEDFTEHPYAQMLGRPELMPRIREYAVAASEQLNIQWKSPESGAFAINSYQLLQSVMNLVTASSPARDGSIHTTLGEHYESNPEFEGSKNPEDYRRLGRLVRSELGPFMDRAPDDWRELARAYGSPSGGIITEAAPADIESLLRLADGKLRANEIMTAERTLGWHADRWRIDKGVVEICNLSHAGDHLDKLPAAEETIVKSIQALEAYFDDPEAAENYREAWTGVIPLPHERDDMEYRQRVVDVSRVNNMLVAVFGKEGNKGENENVGGDIFDADWEQRSPRDIFNAFVSFMDHYAPEPLSKESAEVIRATLEPAPSTDNFETMNEVLEYFYTRRSRMTAAEALRMAWEKDDGNPPVSLNSLLLRMAQIAIRKRRERQHAKS